MEEINYVNLDHHKTSVMRKSIVEKIHFTRHIYNIK